LILSSKWFRAILPLALVVSPVAAQTVTATLSLGVPVGNAALNPITNKIYVANPANSSLTVIDGSWNWVSSIPVGANPGPIAVNTVTNKIYVANTADGTVTAIDGVTGNTATIAVGTTPNSIAVNALTNKVYVVSEGLAPCYSGSVTVINGLNNVTTAVSVGTLPQGIAVNVITNKIYVGGSNGVTVIDGATNTTSTIAAGTPVQLLATNQVTNKVYAASFAANSLTVIDGTTNSVTSTNVGTDPQAIAVNPVTNKIYVANYLDGTVSTVDGSTLTVTAVAAGQSPDAISVDTLSNQIYVANSGSNTITVIDGPTNTPTAFAVGAAPVSLIVNPITAKLYVSNGGDNTVSVIDSSKNAVTSIAVGTNPQSASTNPVTNKVYIANFSSNALTVLDAATNTTISVPTGSAPTAVVANSMTNKIYVANQGSSNVTLIDGATNNTTNIPVGNGPDGLALNPVLNKVYVSNGIDNTVTVIDGATNNTTTGSVGRSPGAIAVNQATNLIYVLNNGDDTVSVIDATTNNSVAFPVGANPTGIAVNPVTNMVYVANSSGSSVTVMDGDTNETSTVTAGDTPTAIAVNSIANKVYVANNGSNNITVIDGATNQTTTVPVGSAPSSIVVSLVTNRVYVTNSNSANITIIDGATLATSTVATGPQPAGVSINRYTDQVYIVNSGNNTVSVLQDQPVYAMPLTASVTPLPGDVSSAATAQFTFNAADSTSGATVDNVLFQVDTWQGAWSPAKNQGGGTFSGTTASLQAGLHYLYTYSTDGQDAAAGNPGFGDSLLVGNIAAYRFVVQSPLQITPLAMEFGPQTLGTSSPGQVVTLTNGGPTLSISYISLLGPFTQTNTCGSSLAAGSNCAISVRFAPLTPGTADGALIIADNAPGAGQVIPLLGVGVGVPSATNLTASANPVNSGQTVTFTATVTGTSNTPTGTARFFDGGVSLGVVTLNSSGSAQFTAVNLSSGTHVITVTFTGDSTYSGSSSNPVNENVLNVVAVKVAAAGASVVFNSLADDAVGNASICGTNHWTKSLGGLMHDNRNGLHGISINDEMADVWVTWDGGTDGTTATVGCLFVALDSTIAVRGYMASPRARLQIVSGLSSSPGDNLLPWLGADAPLPLSLLNAINGSVAPPFTGTAPNLIMTELRPEDIQYAAARALSKLTPGRSGLGYGDWPNPTTFGSTVVGAQVGSSYSASVSAACDFEIAPLGVDPISGSPPGRWETYPIGVVPILIIGSNEDNSATGLGQGLNPGFAGPGPWTAGPYAASNLGRFTAGYVFNGSLTRTTDILPNGTSLASSCVGGSCGLTQLQREMISASYNAFEYSGPRSHAVQGSQEDGVVPGVPNMNPLNIVVPSGGIRLRTLGPLEMVNAVCGATCVIPLAGTTPTANRIGYTFWSYNNLKPLAGVHGTGTGNAYNLAPPKGHYFLYEGLDALFNRPADNPDGALNPPICLEVPCPQIPFTHIVDGSYPLWTTLRAVVDNSHYRGDGTPIDALLADLPTSAKKFSDFLTIDQMRVFRSHRDANVAGLDARNGNGCPLDYGNEVGQEMGGAIFNIQSDLDYAFDSSGATNTCLGISPPDSGLVNQVQ